ncbi:MAG: hypothetical protein FMNOHCHN_03933 [Ignavibacteriaceae bacterium]|nr:hypothetical protein [Ignavibacteriaceae bacterium]
MNDAISWTITNLDSIIATALSVIGTASAIAALLGKQDNKWLEYARKAVNFIALNVGKAKNKE